MIDLFPNETVFVQWLLFMIALVTLHWGIFKPVLRILKERKLRTVGEREAAKELGQKSREMMSQCEKRVEEARRRGVRKKDEIKERAEKGVEVLLKKTRGEMDEKSEEIRRGIEKQMRESALQLKLYGRELSREIASKVLEREV